MLTKVLNPNDQVEILDTILVNIFRNFILNKIIKSNNKDFPLITNYIKTNFRKKSRLYKKIIKNGSQEEDLSRLETQSKLCSDLVSSSKNEYYSRLSKKLLMVTNIAGKI